MRRDVMEGKQLVGIKTTLLSEQSVSDFKTQMMRALLKPGTDANRIPKLEPEVANYAEAIGQGIRSAAILERLRTAEGELERLRAESKVVDVKAIMKLLPAAIGRYRALVEDLGNSGIDSNRPERDVLNLTVT